MIITLPHGKKFVDFINNGFSSRIAKSDILQDMYEKQISQYPFVEPTKLIENIGLAIDNLNIDKHEYEQSEIVIFSNKNKVPLKQIFALYAINKVSSLANSFT